MADNLKRVLIITYYWPPSGGSGVQRWLKFAKYLPDHGWLPVVYTPENPELPEIDHSLQEDVRPETVVIKQPIVEPYTLYKKFVGLKKNDRIQTGFLSTKKKKGFAEKIARWIRGNFFIPDARKFWIKPSVKFLAKEIQANPVDLIISTGPPHSMHLIGLKLAQKTNIPWIADFRDPWTNIDFYEDLLLTKMADRRHRWLEKQVLSQATKVLVVGNRMKLEFSELIDSSKIIVLPNGYDDDDAGKNQALVDTKFSIAHIGSFSPARNPHTLWSVLQQLCKELPGFADDLVIRAVGTVDYTVSQSLEQHELTPYLERIAYLPHHEVIQEQQRAAVLLLVVNRSKNAKGILTGKVFEYLLSTRPLLAVGPTDGDLAGLLENVGAAPVVDYDDFEGLKNRVRTLYSNFKQGIAEQAPQVERYSRSNLTRDLATLMMQLSDVKK